MDRRQLLAQYAAAQQRGQSNLYGGPPPAPAPAPPPPPRRSGGAGSSYEEMRAALREQKEAEGRETIAGLAPSLFEGGSSLGQFIEKGVKLPLDALGASSRASVAAFDALAGTGAGRAATSSGAGGLGNVLRAFDTTDENPQSYLDKVKDPSYGFGRAMKKSGNSSVDRTLGFVGDVAFDPSLYLGAAATKAAAGTDRLGREAMAGTLQRLGYDDAVVGSASRYGAAFLDDAAREAVGMRAPGLYFGVGESSFRIPGTTGVGKAIERTASSARVNTISKVTNRANLAMRTPNGGRGMTADLREARRVLNAGRTIDGVTPSEAAARMRFHQVSKAGGGSYSHPKMASLKSLLDGVDDRSSHSLSYALETGDQTANGWRGFFRSVRQDLVDAGIEVGDLGENYFPHRRTQDGMRWMSNTPEGKALADAIKVDPTADPTLLHARLITGGSTIELPGGKKIEVPAGGTAREINDAIQKAVPNAPRLLEEDIRKVAAAYVNEAGKAMGLRRAFQDLVAGGGNAVDKLSNVASEDLDVLATVTANTQLRNELKKVLKTRQTDYQKRVKTAARAAEDLRKSLAETLTGRAKRLGDEAAYARGDLKKIVDEINSANASVPSIQKSFSDVRKKADKELERIAKETEKAQDALLAAELRLTQVTPDPNAIALGGPTHPTILAHQDALARLADEMDDAKDFKEMIDDLYADFYEQAAELNRLNEFADSPEMIAESAAEMFATTEAFQVPVYGKAITADDPQVAAIQKRIDEAETPEAVEEATRLTLEKAERAQLVAESLGRRARSVRGQITRTERELLNTPKYIDEVTPQQTAYVDALDSAEEGAIGAMADARGASAAAGLKDQQRDAARMATTGQARMDEQGARGAADLAGINLEQAATQRAGQRSQIGSNRTQVAAARRESDRALERLDAASQRLADARVELEETLAAIGTGDKTAAEKVGKLLDSIRFIREERERIALEIDATTLNPRRLELRAKQDKQWETYGRMLAAKREYEYLARRPIREGSDPKVLRSVLRDLEGMSRARELRREVIGYEERSRVLKRTPRTSEELAAERAALEAELAAFREGASPTVSLPRAGQKRGVSEEEANVLNGYIENLQGAVTAAQQNYDRIRNERAKLFPNSSTSRYLFEGEANAAGRIDRTKMSDAGFEIPSYGLTKEDYDAASAGAGVPSFREVRNRAFVDDASDFEQLADAEFDLSTLDTSELFSGQARLSDAQNPEMAQRWERAMAADGVQGEMQGSGRLDFEAYTRELTEARQTLAGTKRAYATAMRAYGLDSPEAMRAFPYGKRDYIMLVDRTGDGQLRVGRAVRTTERELYDEAEKRGLIKAGGRRPKHADLARMLGYKAKLYKPGTKSYAALPEGIVESAKNMTAREQIRLMPESYRRALLSDARETVRGTAEYRTGREALLKRQLADIDREAKQVAEAERVALQAIEQQQADMAETLRQVERLQGTQRKAVEAEGDVRQLQAQTDEAGRVAAQRQTDAQAAVDDARGRVDSLDRQLQGLEEVEKRVGKLEADAMRDLSVSQAIKGYEASLAQSKAWNKKAAHEEAKKVASTVPAKWRNDKVTRGVVKKRLDGLEAVMTEAGKDLSPEMVATAELLKSAQRAMVKVDQEADFSKGLNSMIQRAAKANRILRDETASPEAKLAAARNSPAGAIMRAAYDGFATIESKVFPEGTDYVVKAELNRMLTELEMQLTDAPHKLLRYWDEANQLFKTYATATPGFHVRNLMSSSFMNMTEGVSVQTHIEAQRKWNSYMKAAADGRGDEYLAGLKDTDRAAFEAVMGSGVAGHYSTAELGTSLQDRSAGFVKNNKVVAALRHFGENRVEGPVRLALAMHYTRNRGASMLQALGAVQRIHFDYSEISKFDQGMKRLIPFWTFMSRNLPLQVEQIWKKPRAYMVYNHAMNNFDQSIGEQEMMPGYLEDQGAIVGARDVGFMGGDMVVAPDMPFTRMGQELGNIAPDPTQLLASSSPFLRLPIELKTNHSFFYDGPMSEQPGLGDEALYAARGILPTVGQVERIGGVGKYDSKQAQGVMNYLGLPFKQLNEDVRAAELRRRAFES